MIDFLCLLVASFLFAGGARSVTQEGEFLHGFYRVLLWLKEKGFYFPLQAYMCEPCFYGWSFILVTALYFLLFSTYKVLFFIIVGTPAAIFLKKLHQLNATINDDNNN